MGGSVGEDRRDLLRRLGAADVWRFCRVVAGRGSVCRVLGLVERSIVTGNDKKSKKGG